MKKYYANEEAAIQVIHDLVATAKRRTDVFDVPSAFIAEHPWTLKYLSHFSEADTLFHLLKEKDATISVIHMTEAERSYRLQKSMRPVFRISVEPSMKTPASACRRTVFEFEKQEDGTYRCLNG
ncbi:MAG: hypothetical protein HGB03_02960 [Candidatus Yonathbacteria bacterium]|nr:hypothetical protein [Candidatus Yonathbacteria bacterium]NTW47405.1 hypothetical protein [Candidatus Yonathbacteria bacterium]